MTSIYFSKAPRVYEVIAGALLCLFGAFLGLAGIASLAALFKPVEGRVTLFWAAIICTAVAFLCLRLAFPLLRGTGRDGREELFSPAALRWFGVILLVGAVIGLVSGTLKWFHLIEPVALAVASWALAARRQRGKLTVEPKVMG